MRSTNALDEVTSYAYDTAGQLVSVAYPSGLVRSNLYFTSGAYTNWLEATVDYAGSTPLRTNRFTYTNGFVHTHTDGGD